MSKLKKAMEKAKEAREREPGSPVSGEGQQPAGSPLPHPIREAPGRRDVSCTYTTTRVEATDPGLLDRNKVITLCHKDAMTDQTKILRAQVLNSLKEIGGNSLLITSAREGEGKTLTAINLAVSISHELDRTVLLIDADLRKPSIHRFFGIRNNGGLSDFLLNRAEIPDVLVNPGLEKLTMILGGKPLPNSSELLGSPRMEAMVMEVKARYCEDRMVIFDSPSLLSCADPLVLSQFVDGILLVVEAEKTPSGDIERALELLKDRPVIGTILNKARDQVL